MIRRSTVVLLLAGAALTGLAAPASAHTSLTSSDPAKGATLPVPPQQIRLTFNEPVQLSEGGLGVVGPGGAQWTVGTPAVAGPVVTAPVTPSGPAGEYTINYRVISADGDPVRGTVKFTLAEAVPVPTPTTTTTTTATTTPPTGAAPTATQPQPAPVADQREDSGPGLWLWLVGAVVIVAIVALLVVRSRKGSGSAG